MKKSAILLLLNLPNALFSQHEVAFIPTPSSETGALSAQNLVVIISPNTLALVSVTLAVISGLLLYAVPILWKQVRKSRQLWEAQGLLLDEQLRRLEAEKNLQTQELLRAMRKERENVQRITIPTQDGVLFCVVRNVVRIEADGSYALLHCDDGQQLLASQTLAVLESRLGHFPGFARIHKSHLVNLDYVVKYRKGDGGAVFLSNHTRIPVSRTAKPELLRKLGLSDC